MKKTICLSLFLFSSHVLSQNIATCGGTEGYAFHHHHGIINKSDSGFTKDKISGGLTTLLKKPDGSYDILMVDTRKKIISLTEDGGKIFLLRKGSKDATFMHFHQGMVIEIYTFWIDAEGNKYHDLIQSKGGDGMPIHKSSVLTGRCDEIRLDLIE
jgi:hypothetical protein